MKHKRRHILQLLGGLSAAPFFFSRTHQQKHAFYIAPDGHDDAPGTLDNPWATLTKAAQTLTAGDTVYIRGGKYKLTEAITPEQSGTTTAWITYRNYPGDRPVFDADQISVGPWGGRIPTTTDPQTEDDPNQSLAYQNRPYDPEQGAFQISGKSYLRIQGLTLQNAHSAGFAVRNSHHIDLFNNTTINTFSCGIIIEAGFPVPPEQRSHHCRVIGNTITGANNSALQIIHPGYTNHTHSPHEAISVGSVDHFELAYNHVSYCYKELIDCKDSSRHGLVHHNYLHNGKTGIYIDAWFDDLRDIEVYQNVIHACKMGLSISSEGGTIAADIQVHHNQIFDNLGSGIILGQWGHEGWRENIAITNNTIYRNGYGDGDEEGNNTQTPYWITGGLYLYSTKLKDIQVANNIFNANQYFQIGHTQNYAAGQLDAQDVQISHNLFFEPVDYPATTPLEKWAKDVVVAIYGQNPIEGNPNFVERDLPDLRLRPGSPAIAQGRTDLPHTHRDLGALPSGEPADFWWAYHFPDRVDPEAVSEVSW